MDYSLIVKGTEENGSHYVVYGYFSLDGQFVELSRENIEVATLKQQLQNDSHTPYNLESNTLECSHEWEKYVGIYDAFDYCTKCDKKNRG